MVSTHSSDSSFFAVLQSMERKPERFIRGMNVEAYKENLFERIVNGTIGERKIGCPMQSTAVQDFSRQ